MQEHLKSIFSNVNDWLKFAEAKNGVLVGFDGGAVLTVSSAFLFNKDMAIMSNPLVKAYFASFVICALLGLIISMVSFLPKVEIPWLFRDNMQPSDNLLFFGDIRKYDEKAYLDRLCESLSLNKKPAYSEMEKCYANQIIVNSKIAMKKYAFFNAALWFTLAGVITPVVALVMWTIFKMSNE